MLLRLKKAEVLVKDISKTRNIKEELQLIRSMTGFGRSKYENELREYIVEIKAVNNRYNDVNIKMSRSISYLEEKVKKVITNTISRGKLDVYVGFVNNSDTGKEIKLNVDLAKRYIDELKKLSSETGIIDDINVMEVSKLPDVFSIRTEDEEAEEIIWEELLICLTEGLDNLVKMRETEGEKIKTDMKERLNDISKKITEISKLSSGLVNEYIVKLEKRVNEILKNNPVDESRLAQEIVMYSDKSSVQEELTRLKSHISQFLNLLEEDIAIGKKLDFLVQEINREINTIGSKANNLEITNLVVDIKTEIENIREQIQNIE